MSGSSFIALIPLSFLFNFNAIAQTDSILSNSIPELYLNEITVTAFQTDSKLKTIPAAITVIQPSYETTAATNLIDKFSIVPGMHVQQGALNTSRLSIRGIGTRYPYGTRKIKVLFNQIPLTNGEGDTFIDDILPEETEAIEIIRGPASSVYGSALGGTILIRLNENRLYEKTIDFSSNIGSFNYFKNSARFHSGTFGKNINIAISQLNNSGFRENSKYNRSSAALYSSGNLGKNKEYNLLFSAAKVFAQIPSSLDSITFVGHPDYAATTWKNTQGHENYKRIHSGTGITLHPGLKSDINFIFYTSFRTGSETRPFNLLDEDDASIGTKIVFQSKQRLLGSFTKFVTGFNVFREFYNASIFENTDGKGIQGNKISRDRQNIWQNDIFIQEETDIWKHLKLTIGLNLNISGFNYKDLYSADSIDQSGNYKFSPIISPRIAFNHNINRSLFCYLGLSHGFSLPSLSETLSPLGLINRDIKPERAWNMETGIRGYILRGQTFVDIALYHMWVTHLIVPKRIAEDSYVGMNAGSSDHRGLELAIRNRIMGKYNSQNIPISKIILLINFSYSYNQFRFGNFLQDSINFSGNYLPGVPKHQFNSEITLETRIGFYVNQRFYSISNVPLTDDNSRFSSGYNILDATIGYSSHFSKKWAFRLHFSIQNITNTKYASMVVINAPGTPSRLPRYYYPGDPIKYRLGFTVKYNIN